ncbi:MAG: class I SAM-dependent methyltransferase [Acidobacteria bacterium]|nr:class I SAM-dependent methyltransferase [Acidobacteriota bacterium]
MKQGSRGTAGSAAPRLASLDPETFRKRLLAVRGVPDPGPAGLAALHAHYSELVRWSARIDLVGPAAAEEIFERHYAESLAALPLLPAEGGRLVDLGSGAGFPGFVLAAVRPDLDVILVEPRQKRRAFLAAAARSAALSCRILDARVSPNAPPELPGGIDMVTLRALRLDRLALERLLPLLAPNGRIVAWSGRDGLDLPPGLVPGRTLPLPESEHRALREYLRTETK